MNSSLTGTCVFWFCVPATRDRLNHDAGATLSYAIALVNMHMLDIFLSDSRSVLNMLIGKKVLAKVEGL